MYAYICMYIYIYTYMPHLFIHVTSPSRRLLQVGDVTVGSFVMSRFIDGSAGRLWNESQALLFPESDEFVAAMWELRGIKKFD